MYRFRIAVALCLIVSLSPVQAQLIFASGFEDGEGGTMGIPPNPEDVAPDRDGAGNTGPCEAYGFLFNGAQPVQINVDEASIDCDKLAVLGGRVVDASMAPVIGVAVMVKDRPEFGMTLTRADGEYDLAVNGGGPLTLLFSRDGLLNADRETQVPPRADLTLEDVMLVALDGNVTTVMANMPEPQLVSGSMRTDSDGSRTARLMIPANTTMMMGNGAGGMDPMSQLDVRITEYTVGENGPMAMPADLPPTSGYTYAVEFSADEGITSPVTFNQALASYNENFLGFPTGTVIPHGWYDRELGQWVPAENGRVIEILTEAAGTVTVAVDSTGAAADTSKLMQAGISSDELEMLAQLFQPGDTLWRVPIRHFSPHDYNFPLPDDAEPPPPPPPLPDDVDVDTSDPDYGRIEYQTQVFQETLGLVGVPFDLHYSSYRTPGRNAERTLRVPITRSSVPTGLSGAQLVVNVAGIRNEYLLGPDPGQSFTIRWNGRDRYDRPVFGTQNLSYELAYRFPITYRFAQVDGTGAEPPRVFGRILQLENSQGRSLVITTQPRRFRRTVPGLLDWRPLGVGGWSPSVHHFYDQAGGIVYRGDGTRQTDGGSELIYTINNFAGGGTTIEDGAPATEAFMENAEQMAIASDGTLYYTESDGDFGEYRIRAVDPDGTVRTVLPFGGTDCPSENELVSDIGITGVAASSFASQVAVLAVDKQDRLYFAAAFCPDMPFVDEQEEEFYPFLIYRIEGDRAVRVAGTELINFSPVDGFFDDVSALDFQMTSVEDLEFFDDGTMAILEYGRFYRLEPDGSVRHFAGVANCFPGFCEPDGALAKTAVLELPNDMATLPDGGIVFAGSQFDSPIRKITRDGIVQTILPSQEERSIYNITAGPDGVIYAATTSEDFPFVQELLAIEPDGSTRLIAGGPVDQPYASEGGPARQQRFGPLDIDIGPDGAIYGTVFPGITRIVPGDEPVPLADTLVASSDSPEVFRFAANGRHQETRHALTGGLLWQFGYNDEGFLVSVTDGYGNASTIARDGSGQPTSVTGPDGQVTILSVDGNGFLASSTTPGNASIDFEYTTQGLLTAVETATDDRYTMVYDSDGLLTSVTDPADATTTLARQFIADGTRVTVTTPEGEVTRYDRTVGNSRDVTTSISRPDGTVETVLVETNGTVTRMLADGTALEDVLAPDPRFAMQSPYIVQSSLSLPGGTTQITDRSRSATLENTGGLLDLQSLTETITVAGQSTAYQY
ncbi:MAG: hypothetical protein QNJ40_23730, partial [Xanthomonadales bacterium]|nr:hypothetical protein [Xanthomonadales bacterium]